MVISECPAFGLQAFLTNVNADEAGVEASKIRRGEFGKEDGRRD